MRLTVAEYGNIDKICMYLPCKCESNTCLVDQLNKYYYMSQHIHKPIKTHFTFIGLCFNL